MVRGLQRCDWSRLDSHRLGRERGANGPPPLHATLGCVELGQMTSFWQDYPKPGSNLYSTHNRFLQHDKENKQQIRRPDPGGSERVAGLAAVLIIPDRFYHLKATRVSKWDSIIASPGDFLFNKHEEMNSEAHAQMCVTVTDT